MLTSRQQTSRGEYASDTDNEDVRKSQITNDKLKKRYTMDPPLFKQQHNAMPLSMKIKKHLATRTLYGAVMHKQSFKDGETPLTGSMLAAKKMNSSPDAQRSHMRNLKSTNDMQLLKSKIIQQSMSGTEIQRNPVLTFSQKPFDDTVYLPNSTVQSTGSPRVGLNI